jgi:hypothetical protein
MVDAPESLSPPPRGPAIDVLQLSGSRSQTFWQCLSRGHYEQDIFSVKFFWLLALLSTTRHNYNVKKIKITERVLKSWPHLWVQTLSQAGPGGLCRYPTDQVPLHTSFKSRQGAEHAPTQCHVPCSTRSSLPVKVGSGATRCPVLRIPPP